MGQPLNDYILNDEYLGDDDLGDFGMGDDSSLCIKGNLEKILDIGGEILEKIGYDEDEVGLEVMEKKGLIFQRGEKPHSDIYKNTKIDTIVKKIRSYYEEKYLNGRKINNFSEGTDLRITDIIKKGLNKGSEIYSKGKWLKIMSLSSDGYIIIDSNKGYISTIVNPFKILNFRECKTIETKEVISDVQEDVIDIIKVSNEIKIKLTKYLEEYGINNKLDYIKLFDASHYFHGGKGKSKEIKAGVVKIFNESHEYRKSQSVVIGTTVTVMSELLFELLYENPVQIEYHKILELHYEKFSYTEVIPEKRIDQDNLILCYKILLRLGYTFEVAPVKMTPAGFSQMMKWWKEEIDKNK